MVPRDEGLCWFHLLCYVFKDVAIAVRQNDRELCGWSIFVCSHHNRKSFNHIRYIRWVNMAWVWAFHNVLSHSKTRAADYLLKTHGSERGEQEGTARSSPKRSIVDPNDSFLSSEIVCSRSSIQRFHRMDMQAATYKSRGTAGRGLTLWRPLCITSMIPFSCSCTTNPPHAPSSAGSSIHRSVPRAYFRAKWPFHPQPNFPQQWIRRRPVCLLCSVVVRIVILAEPWSISQPITFN